VAIAPSATERPQGFGFDAHPTARRLVIHGRVAAAVGKAVGSPVRFASDFISDLPVNGQINLLTSTSFDHPQNLFTFDSGLPTGVAFVSLSAPTMTGSWTCAAAQPKVICRRGSSPARIPGSRPGRPTAIGRACRTRCSAISGATPTRCRDGRWSAQSGGDVRVRSLDAHSAARRELRRPLCALRLSRQRHAAKPESQRHGPAAAARLAASPRPGIAT
jgi:hypothetical protein